MKMSSLTNFNILSEFQDALVMTNNDWNPNYLIAIISGVLLALAFQLILTALSVAIGVTAVGNLKESYAESKYSSSDKNNSDNSKDDYRFDQDYGSGTPLGVKITSGFGIWSVLTTCISLFAATWIAIRMSIFSIDGTDIATGLVTWALFFIILFYLELKAANTVIGGLINTALAGIRGTASTIKDAFTPSDSSKLDSAIDKTVSRIRNEFDNAFDGNEIYNVVDRFFEKADKKLPDYDSLINDLEGIAKNSKSKSNHGKWMAIQGAVNKMMDDDGDTNADRSKSEKLKKLTKTIKEKYSEGDGTYDSLAKVTESLSSADREQIDDFYQKFEKFLTSSSEEGLDKASIKRKINEIKEDPTVLKTMIGNNVEELNRDSIVNLLDKNSNIERSKLENYANQVEAQITAVRQEYFSGNDTGLVDSAKTRIQTYLDGTDRKELRYDALKDDFTKALNNPDESLSILRNRLSKMDEDSLRALLTNNKHISENNIDSVVSQFESAKQTVGDKFTAMQDEIDRNVENIKRKAVIQAEHTRKTSASAAWWLVATAILSALASIGGSAVAI